ncbi:MAG: glycosyltransferase family 4 protein [Candidatus Bathyarchaeia archaeon]
MNILYYIEPKRGEGGVSNVASYLPKALSRKANVTYFPRIVSKKGILNIFNVYWKYVLGKFDVIHFNVPPTWINGSYIMLKSARRCGIPTVLNIHGLVQLEHAFDPKVRPISYLQLLNYSNSSNLVDRIVVNSEYMKKRVAVSYRLNRDKIVVIPNGIDLREFKKNNAKIELDGDPAILSVGLVSFVKGFDILIRSTAMLKHKLPKMKVHFVGQAAKQYINLAKASGLEDSIVFHGEVEHSMINRYYASADILVIASRTEGFSLALIEAMASGLPVVASNIGSLSEIISNGTNGILFQNENSVNLSNAIFELHQNPILRRHFSDNGLKTSKKYDWKNIAEKYISLYRELAS